MCLSFQTTIDISQVTDIINIQKQEGRRKHGLFLATGTKFLVFSNDSRKSRQPPSPPAPLYFDFQCFWLSSRIQAYSSYIDSLIVINNIIGIVRYSFFNQYALTKRIHDEIRYIVPAGRWRQEEAVKLSCFNYDFLRLLSFLWEPDKFDLLPWKKNCALCKLSLWDIKTKFQCFFYSHKFTYNWGIGYRLWIWRYARVPYIRKYVQWMPSGYRLKLVWSSI